MLHMQEWNDELAAVAQAYSSKCDVQQPNPDRSSQAPSFTTVGENSGVSMPPSSSSFSCGLMDDCYTTTPLECALYISFVIRTHI